MTAIGQAMSTKKRRRKQRRQSGALRMPSNSDRKTAEERAADPVVKAVVSAYCASPDRSQQRRQLLSLQLLRLWTAQHHQFACFQLQKAAAPAASLQETGASRQAQVAKKRKTRKRSVSASAEATAVAPSLTEALATEGTVEASSIQAKPAAKARWSKSASKTSKQATECRTTKQQ